MSRRAIAFDQADSRLHTIGAVFVAILEDRGHAYRHRPRRQRTAAPGRTPRRGRSRGEHRPGDHGDCRPRPEHEIVVTHGNGPQIGLLAEESAADPALRAPYPLDLLGAQTQGMIGSLLVRTLHDALPGHRIAALVTHTLVRADDPAFGRPTKFVGQVYPRKTAECLARRHGWHIAKDGRGWRRVVPSPSPERILEIETIHDLLGTHALVLCAGGGRHPRHRRQRHRCADRRRCGRRQGPHGGSARRGPQGRLPAHPHRRPVRLRRLRHP